MPTPAQLKKGHAIVHEGQPYIVLSAAHHKMGRGGAIVRSKLKNMKNGTVLEVTYQGNEKIKDADVEYKRAQFLYADDSGAHFMDESFEQHALSGDIAEESLPYLKEGIQVDVVFSNGVPISLQLPPKVELTVTDAPPGVKGDSANNPSKTIVLESGLSMQAPMFINNGDVVRVNTESGEYVERA